jgi:hypothetical protein
VKGVAIQTGLARSGKGSRSFYQVNLAVASVTLSEAGGYDGPTKNKKDNYNARRFIAKTLYQPMFRRALRDEGRAAPLSVLLLSFQA